MNLRLLVATDRPVIQGYDQDTFARQLYYDRPHEMSLELFRCARSSTVEILDRLTPEQWIKEGTHSEVGRFGVEQWLTTYAEHAHNHADQIRRARASASCGTRPARMRPRRSASSHSAGRVQWSPAVAE